MDYLSTHGDLDTNRLERNQEAAQSYWLEGVTDATDSNSPQRRDNSAYLDGYFATLRRMIQETDRQFCPTWQDTAQTSPPPPPSWTCADCVNYFPSHRNGEGYCPCVPHVNEWGEEEIGKPVTSATPACSKFHLDAPF